ncbi:MAG: Uncharacterised protein [Flavobacteriales bacterium]|nr:MAG: Uncharacterised protein [Flavobacteriales bacterium]
MLRIQRRNNFWCIGSCNCRTCSAVKGIFKRNNFSLFVVERGEFKRIFICFCSRATHKQLVTLASRLRFNFIRQLLLQRILNSVGIKSNSTHLLFQPSVINRVLVSNANHRMTAIQIQIFFSVCTIYMNAFCANRRYIIKRIYIK